VTPLTAGSGLWEAHVADGSRSWESETFALQLGQDYRLEGWVRSRQAEAHLGLDQLGAGGAVMNPSKRRASTTKSNGAMWRWNLPPSNRKQKSGSAARGPQSSMTSLLRPSAIPYLGNSDVQPDATGRIGLWGEEKEDIAQGTRAGTHRSDPETKRRSLPSLLVESTGRLVTRGFG